MASGKERKTSCSIFAWLKRAHPEFADNIEDGLCLSFGIFKPKRGHNGLTFLLPDKATRKTINDLSFGHPEDVKKATELLKSFILPDYFKDTASFKDHPVGNILGGLFAVSKTTNKEVHFADGSTAEKVKTEFTGENVAIWELKGTPSATGTDYKPRKKDTTGGAVLNPRHDDLGDNIRRYWDNATNLLLKKKPDNGHNPLLIFVISIMDNLKRKHKSYYKIGLTLLNRNPLVALYGLLMPAFTRSDLRFIPCEVILDCLRTGPADSSLDSDFNVKPDVWISHFKEACGLKESTMDLVKGSGIKGSSSFNLGYNSILALHYDEIYFVIALSMSSCKDYESAILKVNAIVELVRNSGEHGKSILLASGIPTSVNVKTIEKFKNTEAYKRKPNMRTTKPNHKHLLDVEFIHDEEGEVQQLSYPVEDYIVI
jgi:hypothetical protein